MAENTLQMHAEQIAAHMSQTGELPSTNEVLSQPVNKTPENQPTIIAHGLFQQEGKTMKIGFFTYTPIGSNGKPLAPRYRITVQDGTEIRRFDLRAVKSDDSKLSDGLEHLITGG